MGPGCLASSAALAIVPTNSVCMSLISRSSYLDDSESLYHLVLGVHQSLDSAAKPSMLHLKGVSCTWCLVAWLNPIERSQARGKHRPPPPPIHTVSWRVIISPISKSTAASSISTRLDITETYYPEHSSSRAYKYCVSPSWSSASSVTLVLTSPTVIGLAVELSPISYLEPRVDSCNLLRGGYSDSGISSLRSTGDGMDRDGGSGGSGGGGNAVVTASMRVRLSLCLWWKELWKSGTRDGILASNSKCQWEGGGIQALFPSGGKKGHQRYDG
ncbi:hypothetical protein Tco_0663850 [Tanacetum coccineum]